LNPERADLRQTLEAILRTWPEGQQPKLHYSSPRTELREQVRVDKKTRKKIVKYVAPVFTGHADFVNPFEFATFMRVVDGLNFDVMLEAKAKDLALLRLRPDLLRYAPDVAARFGLEAEDVFVLEQQSDEVVAEEPGADNA
jgi:UV DNA damage endonuclease